MSGYSSRKNGRRGGRPKSGAEIKFSIPELELVMLTPEQYNSLSEKYGDNLLKKALLILEEWLKTSPKGEKYRGRNNYAHFRADGWVINSARISS